MNNTEKVYNAIYDYMYVEYNIPYTNMDSNWYTDLNCNDFQRHDLFEFLKKEFHIEKMPLMYFANIGVLCNAIAKILDEREIKEKQILAKREAKQKKKLERIENFNKNKIVIWFKTNLQRIKD